MTTYQPDEKVNITFRHATVDYHCDPANGDTALVVSIPGCEQQFDIPLVDDEGKALYAHLVTIERPAQCAGCGRVLPLDEAMAGFATCEHCPAPDDPHQVTWDDESGEDMVRIHLGTAQLVALTPAEMLRLGQRLVRVSTEALASIADAAQLGGEGA